MNHPLFALLVPFDGRVHGSEPHEPADRMTQPRWARRIALTALALACLAPLGARADESRRAATAPAPERVIDDARWREPRCRAGVDGETFFRTELFFGLSRPGGIITEADFQNFVGASVTPRFPDGLTLLTGVGQFRDASGTTIVEGSKLLILLYPRRDPEASRKIEQIRADYKYQFRQQSVLRTDELSCVSF